MFDWYMNCGDETIEGPLSEGELLSKLCSDLAKRRNALVWHKGMDAWVAASDHFKTSLPPLLPHAGVSSSPAPVASFIRASPPPLPNRPDYGNNYETGGILQQQEPISTFESISADERVSGTTYNQQPQRPYIAPKTGKADFGSWISFNIGAIMLFLFHAWAVGRASNTPLRPANHSAGFLDQHQLAAVLLVIGLTLWVVSSCYYVGIVRKAWQLLPRRKGQPVKLVHPAYLLFVPVLSWYWMYKAFYGWASEWSRVKCMFSGLESAPDVSPPKYKLWCICAGVLPPGLFFVALFLGVWAGLDLRQTRAFETMMGSSMILAIMNLIWPAVGLAGQIVLYPAVRSMSNAVNYCHRLRKAEKIKNA